MRFFYTLFVLFYHLAVILVSPFNAKANLRRRGVKKVFRELEEKCSELEHVICFHCASLGEFEQGKPLMEKIKREHPGYTIMVTFFSPSGYEIKKNDPIADIVTYLPVDTPRNNRKFLDIVKPEAFFFIKYEFWFNLMDGLDKYHIPFFYISAIFRPGQYFFKKRGKWFAAHLKNATYFFVQDIQSKALLQNLNIENVEVTGDTRFDRVMEIAMQQFQLDFVISFKNSGKLIVGGSTWKPDEELLKEVMDAIPGAYKLILAPHLVDTKHIKEIKKLFEDYPVTTYSESKNQNPADFQILIIDNIGMLNKIYKYSDISYIGGAFETGLHNILEATVYGVPVFFGPHYQKFNEATALIKSGGAYSVRKSREMTEKLYEFENSPETYEEVCRSSKEYVQQNLGACDKIYRKLKELKIPDF